MALTEAEDIIDLPKVNSIIQYQQKSHLLVSLLF